MLPRSQHQDFMREAIDKYHSHGMADGLTFEETTAVFAFTWDTNIGSTAPSGATRSSAAAGTVTGGGTVAPFSVMQTTLLQGQLDAKCVEWYSHLIKAGGKLLQLQAVSPTRLASDALYRGMQGTGLVSTQQGASAVVSNFWSFSLDAAMAFVFSGDGSGAGGTVMHMKDDATTNIAARIEAYSKFPLERECLVLPKSAMRVIASLPAGSAGALLPSSLAHRDVIVLVPCPAVPSTIHGAGNFIYAVGGEDGSNVLDSVVRYDTTTNIWSAVAVMPTKRRNHGVV